MNMKSNGPGAWRGLFLGLMASICWLAGCTGGTPTGSVAGEVTCNGVPLAAGIVLFSSQEAGVGASTELDASGAYRIESIPIGEYKVSFQPPPPPDPMAMQDAAVIPQMDIPAKYQGPDTSGLTVTVKEGTNTKDFAL